MLGLFPVTYAGSGQGHRGLYCRGRPDFLKTIFIQVVVKILWTQLAKRKVAIGCALACYGVSWMLVFALYMLEASGWLVLPGGLWTAFARIYSLFWTTFSSGWTGAWDSTNIGTVRAPCPLCCTSCNFLLLALTEGGWGVVQKRLQITYCMPCTNQIF